MLSVRVASSFLFKEHSCRLALFRWASQTSLLRSNEQIGRTERDVARPPSSGSRDSRAALARHVKDLRRRFGGKQWWLAHVAGCTDAAVSFWESGERRIPQARTLANHRCPSTGRRIAGRAGEPAEKVWRRNVFGAQQAGVRPKRASMNPPPCGKPTIPCCPIQYRAPIPLVRKGRGV